MGNRVKILLADDSDDDEFLFRRSLEDIPSVRIVWRAQDGEQTIKYLSGEGIFADRTAHPFPDALVLDLKMPNRGGFEVLEWLGGRFPRLMVGVFSSSELPEDIERATLLGAHLYQSKTYDPVEFGRFMQRLEFLARERGAPNV